MKPGYIVLNKSQILQGINCKKSLYLAINQPEIGVDGGNEMLIKRGIEVGRLARSFFSSGALINTAQDVDDAVVRTKQHLESSPAPLFEATFVHDDVLVRADVLERAGDGLNLIEVKSSTSVKSHHIMDCAIQAWVIEGCSYKLNSIQLMCIDSGFIYPGDEDYNGLFARHDITEKVRDILADVATWKDELVTMLRGACPEPDVGKQCHNPYECGYFDVCIRDESPYPVRKLPRAGMVPQELRYDGIEDIRDIPAGRLKNKNHEWVRRVTVSGQPELKPEATAIIKALDYPRYFIDFESIQFAIPIWEGTRPYQQLPFQWSCHIEQSTGEVDHCDYLATDSSPPMRDFAEQLIEALGDSGSVLVYSPFEKSRLKELVQMYPDLADPLQRIIERLVDLLPIVRQYYYHPEMKGSWSVKAVLPTVAPELDYKSLDEVRDGSMAQMAYLEMIDDATELSRKSYLIERLKAYCELDTLAMVKIAHFLEGK